MSRFASVLIALFCSLGLMTVAGCTSDGAGSEKAGGFGEPKKKDDGTIGKRPELKEAPPDFQSALVVTPSFDAARSTVTVTLKIKDGFHAYAKGEKIGRPVSMTIAAENGWTLDGEVTIPDGKAKDLGELGRSVILEGDVPLKAKVKGGKGALSGTAMVQICTDKACDRPRPHKWSVPTT